MFCGIYTRSQGIHGEKHGRLSLVGPTGAKASLLRNTEPHVQCFTKQDVLLFLYMGFQNFPIICLCSLQISGLKVYSGCGTVHLWMFVWKDGLLLQVHRHRVHRAVLKALGDLCSDSAQC